MLEKEEELKAWIRLNIDQDPNESPGGFTDTSKVERWKCKQFDHFWRKAKPEEVFGAEHEIRYAKRLSDLEEELRQEDPACTGFTYFFSSCNNTDEYAYRDRLYRVRQPLEDTELRGEEAIAMITKAAEVYGSVFLERRRVQQLFGPMQGYKGSNKNYLSMPVGSTCTLQPAPSVHGFFELKYLPQATKRLRDRNDRYREAERRKQEEDAAASREYCRYIEHNNSLKRDIGNRHAIVRSFMILLSKAIKDDLHVVHIAVGNMDNHSGTCTCAQRVCHILSALKSLRCDPIRMFVDKILQLGEQEALRLQVNKLLQSPKEVLAAWRSPDKYIDEIVCSHFGEHGDRAHKHVQANPEVVVEAKAMAKEAYRALSRFIARVNRRMEEEQKRRQRNEKARVRRQARKEQANG